MNAGRQRLMPKKNNVPIEMSTTYAATLRLIFAGKQAIALVEIAQTLKQMAKAIERLERASGRKR